MEFDRVNISSKYPLISDWLKLNCENLGWRTSNYDKVIPDAIALIDISSKDDIPKVLECEKKGVPVVVFTRLEQAKLLCVLYQRELNGLLHMNSSANSIQATLEAAAKQKAYFDEKILTYVLSNKYREIFDSISSLSNRELEIVDAIMEELSNDEIAEKYNLSVRTVNAHKRNILQKMKTRSLVGVCKLMMTYTLRYV